MAYKKSYFVLAWLVLGCPLVLHSQNFESAKSSNAFLDIGVGARAAALGEAYAAVATDASAVFWNPACLSGIENPELLFMHNQWFQDINMECAALAFPLGGSGTLGFLVSYLNYGVVTRLDDAGQPQGEFSSFDSLGALGYALNFSKTFSAGAVLKVPYSSLEDSRYVSLAIDAGLWYKPQAAPWLQLGLVMDNLGTRVAESPQPAKARLGLGVVNSLPGLLLALDASKRFFDEGLDLNAGLEYVIQKNIMPRVGYRYSLDDHGIRGLTAGLGLNIPLNYWKLRLDYAFAPYGDLGNTHRLAATLVFANDLATGRRTAETPYTPPAARAAVQKEVLAASAIMPQPQAQPLEPPTQVKAKKYGEHQVLITWTPPVNREVHGFYVYLMMDKQHAMRISKKMITGKSFATPALKSRHRYAFTVTSVGPNSSESKKSPPVYLRIQ